MIANSELDIDYSRYLVIEAERETSAFEDALIRSATSHGREVIVIYRPKPVPQIVQLHNRRFK